MRSILISRQWPVLPDAVQGDLTDDMEARGVEQALRRAMGDLGSLRRMPKLTPCARAKVVEASRALEEAQRAQQTGA
jgi:hypothetical protein